MDNATHGSPSPQVYEIAARKDATSASTRTEGLNDLGISFVRVLYFVPRMGDKVGQVKDLFFRQSEARGIPGATYSSGFLSIDNQKRDYLFAERYLGNAAKATIGVHIANIGSDLYIEVLHYVLPPKHLLTPQFVTLFVLSTIIPGCCIVLPLIQATMSQSQEHWALLTILVYVLYACAALYFSYRLSVTRRDSWLTGFQSQDNIAFQLAIRAAIDEAVDLAGIPKELRVVTEHQSPLPQPKRDRRVI